MASDTRLSQLCLIAFALLLALLTDSESRVRDAAHLALVQLNKGTDLGPKANASEKERSEAVQKWREWWTAQNGK